MSFARRLKVVFALCVASVPSGDAARSRTPPHSPARARASATSPPQSDVARRLERMSLQPEETDMRDDIDFNIAFCQIIEQYPALYDYNRSDYCNRNVQSRIWRAIANKLQESGEFYHWLYRCDGRMAKANERVSAAAQSFVCSIGCLFIMALKDCLRTSW